MVCELVDLWTRENDKDELIFNLLCWSLDEIATTANIADILIFFQVKLLDIVGVGLQLDYCLSCNKPINAKFYSYIIGHNGLMCANCRSCSNNSSSDLANLSAATIKTLQKALSLPLSKVPRLKLSKDSARQAAKLLRLYSQFQLQRDIHSWKHFGEQLLVD